MNRILASLNIGRRIILGFSLLILLFLVVMITVEVAGIPGTTVIGKFTAARDKNLGDLELASGLLGERLARWFAERRIDVDGLAVSPMLRKTIAIRKPGSNQEITVELKAFLKSHPDIDAVTILDPANASVLAVSGGYKNSLSAVDLAITPDKLSRLIIPGYQETIEYISGHDKRTHLRIIRQMLSTDASQRIIALLIAECDLEEALRPLIWSVRNSIVSHDWECIIASTVGVSLSQFRVGKGGIKPLDIPISDISKSVPIMLALSGINAPYEGLDQFGKNVLAFHRQIAVDRNTALGLVLKVESSLAYKQVKKDLSRQVVLWAALFGTGFILCVFLARQIVGPVKALAAVARKIEDGDFTARSAEIDQTEIGQLAMVVNSMASKIENSHAELEKQVADRTRDLLNQTQRLQLATSAAHLGIWDWNARENILVWDDRMFELFGTTREVFSNNVDAWMNGLHPEDRETAISEFQAALNGEKEFDTEFRVLHPDGTVKHIKGKGLVLRGADGNAERMLGINYDITEAKHAEEEKHKLESQLQQAQKMESVGRLAGGVAHDFNNMLSVIMGHAELGLMRLEATSPVCADLKEISKTAERSADLTRQLLAFARKQTVAPKVIDLNDTVSSMLRMLQRLIGEDINLTWQPSVEQCQVKMDPSQIDQILANLCVNARDAIEDTGWITIETGTCSIDADYCARNPEATPGEYVRLVVSDDGKGMDRETQAHIFEPFYTTKEMGKGTGLGLATVYGAVKQNNGFINIYSEPGQGTTFSIHLPHYAEDTVRKHAEEAAQPVPRGQETILLVEDEAAILNITAIMLEKQGYTVLRADSPGRAMELAREHHGPIHLLMTDVIMPEMNGRDLARNILAIHPGMKRLFMSGYTADVIAHHGVLDEGVNFIQKPFSLPVMAARVREMLDGNSPNST